jgi:predicted transcriptional regulator
MKQKDRANLKDRILSLLMKNTSISTSKIATELNISHFTILGLTEELFKEDLIFRSEMSTTVPEKYEYFIRIKPMGVVLIKDDNGFIRRYKDFRRKQLWIVVKTIAAVLNAIIIIIISIWATRTSLEQKELKRELFKKDSIIFELKLKSFPAIKDTIKLK